VDFAHADGFAVAERRCPQIKSKGQKSEGPEKAQMGMPKTGLCRRN
jgi:hypothetical protein